ncbi:MAG: hypothetical protein LBF41_01805, partial [Deltaproteobacteria bacterium]|nr:hypothetical protein [Deltaproteobacteria bacterium]
MTDEKKVKEINGAKKHIHDKIGKSLFFDNIRGWVLWLIGLVSRKDSWANLMVDEPIQNEFVLPYPTITSVRLDFISTLKYESEFSRDNESKTYLLMIETDQKGLSKNLIKYFKYMATVIEKKFLNSKETTKIQVLFCVIFGTNVIPTEKDMMFASEFSNNMIRIEFIYLSQTDVDELLSSCKIKLKEGKVPSLLDFLKLMYLADLTDKHEQKSKKRAKTGKTLCES